MLLLLPLNSGTGLNRDFSPIEKYFFLTKCVPFLYQDSFPCTSLSYGVSEDCCNSSEPPNVWQCSAMLPWDKFYTLNIFGHFMRTTICRLVEYIAN